MARAPARRPRSLSPLRDALALTGLLLAAALAIAPVAFAQTTARPDPNALSTPESLVAPIAGHTLTGERARRIADAVPRIATVRRRNPGSYSSVFLKGADRWQVSYYRRGRPLKEIGQVQIDDRTGAVLEAWTGDQVAWTMARGYPGAFGRKVNSPIVWIALTILFVAPFAARRPRLLHLDLLVLAAFGVSLAYFNDAQIDRSVPIVYPLLAYLLARASWVALRRPAGSPPRLPLAVPIPWLVVGLVFLIGFRIGLNVTSSNVIDVGYAGVIGADRLAKGEPIYGHFPDDNPQGDTYGPVVYEAYVPFEQIWPWSGEWDDLPAAHAAAIVFDLLCIALLLLVGARARAPGLGVVLAYMWAAFPFTLYAMNSGSNDALVSVLALAALVAGSAGLRGAAAGLGSLAKLGSVALVPLLALHDRRPRAIASFALAAVAVGALASLPILLEHESLRTVYDRTVGFQASRETPFSIWDRYGLDAAQVAWQALAGLLALALAVLPRRRDVVGLAAAMAAILIALQIGAGYWFYLYIPWFFGLLCVALVGRHRLDTGQRRRVTRPATTARAPARSSRRGPWSST